MAPQAETTQEATFYSPWPLFGRRFSSQLDEGRHNFEALHPLVRAAGLDDDNVATALKNQAVQSWEIGEDGFHNKYRMFWDKDNDTFRIQENSGTTGVPSWVDKLIIDSSGGISGDFYISSNLTVSETGSSPVSAAGVLTLFLNREHFYLTKNTQGQPIVNALAVSGGGGGGVTDHGALTGLDPDDDHAQYLLASAAGGRAAFATNWTDLTDAGSTTLHTHDHGDLGGLADDDHTQYLLINGTRAMTGDLLMGGKDVLNAAAGLFNDKVVAEAFYTSTLSIHSTPISAVIESNLSINSEAANAINFTAGTSIGFTATDDIDITSITGEVFLNSSTKIVLSASSGIKEDVVVGRDGLSVLDKVKAEAFYIPGGEVVHFVTATGGTTPEFRKPGLKFNRSDFYLSPDSFGNPVVNLAGSPPISRILLSQSIAQSFAINTADEIDNLQTVISVGNWTHNGTLVTIPSGINAVRVIGQIEWEENVTGVRVIRIGVNSEQTIDGVQWSTAIRPSAVVAGGISNSAIIQATSGILDVSPGDTISIFGVQDSGTLNTVAAGLTLLYIEEVRVTSGGGGVTDHGLLSGLTADDHTQYLLVNGTRAMTGDLNMGGFDLLNASAGVFNDKVVAEAFYLIPGGDVFAYGFNRDNFYVSSSKATPGKKVVNLIAPSTGTALTIADQAAPTFTNTSKITFDSNFYLTPDTTGQPIVNFINNYSAVLISQTGFQTLTQGVSTVLAFGQTVYNIGNWGVNLGAGEITVPAGVTHVRVFACTRTDVPTQAGTISNSIRLNGSTTPPGQGRGSAIYHFSIGANFSAPSIQTWTPLWRVVAGDVISVLVFHTISATTINTDFVNNSTFLSVEGYNYG